MTAMKGVAGLLASFSLVACTGGSGPPAPYVQTHYLKASNPDARDSFGGSMALSADGQVLVVGAPWEASCARGTDGDQADNGCQLSGAAYVFRRIGSTWTQEAYLKAGNTTANDQFATSVAVSADGSTIAVGDIGESSSSVGIDGPEDDHSAPQAGAVFVFSNTSGAWAQQAYVKAANTYSGEAFGRSVALSADGTRLAVGAIDEAKDDMNGAVYVFSRTAGTWAQEAYMNPLHATPMMEFGGTIALAGDGNTLVAGAPIESGAARGVDGDPTNDTAPAAGAAYVFERTSGTWSQQAYLKASNTDAGDEFGFGVSLSLDGSTLAVGAICERSRAFGIDGNQSDNSVAYAGAAYVFTRSGPSWTQEAYLKSSNPQPQQLFGSPLALAANGSTLLVGATGEASGATGDVGTAPQSGAAYLFTRSAGAWRQAQYIKASNAESDDNFGGTLVIAGDAASFAIGASLEASGASGVDGRQDDNSAKGAGAVYTFAAR